MGQSSDARAHVTADRDRRIAPVSSLEAPENHAQTDEIDELHALEVEIDPAARLHEQPQALIELPRRGNVQAPCEREPHPTPSFSVFLDVEVTVVALHRARGSQPHWTNTSRCVQK